MTGKHGFYARLGFSNLRKNGTFYLPSILTGTGLLACFYIVLTLGADERLQNVRGGDYLPVFMGVGAVVIGLLSLILLFYTNGFLMRERTGEYGLYHVLGLEKKHICRISFFETLYCALFVTVAGLALGIVFYKACSLLLCRLLGVDLVPGFYFLTLPTMLPAALVFIGIYLLCFLYNCLRLNRTVTASLLRAKSQGEREPHVKWGMLITGIVTLAGGYTIAVTVKNPLSALLLFFVAVFLVIIGTYCLFIAGSVFVLKKLKNNRRYYYHKRRFTVVANLLHRMKQNAAGLASVCILATGVLVMLSSTTGLYAGMGDVLAARFPRDVVFSLEIGTDESNYVSLPDEVLRAMMEKAAADAGLTVGTMEFTAVRDVLGEETRVLAADFTDARAAELSCDRIIDSLWAQINETVASMEDIDGYYAYVDNVWDSRGELVGMYSCFLFLGIILGTVCLFATALIIYYKQIAEGYEDRPRFQTMKKIGMTDTEIRRTVRAGTLIVFFLPLVTAGIHAAFAFPMICKLLHLLLLADTRTFVIGSLFTYAAFALVYTLIYFGTARTYVKIVN